MSAALEPREWRSGAGAFAGTRRLALASWAGGGLAAQDGAVPKPRLPLFTNVRLLRWVEADGEKMPEGASGTIVHSLAGGAAYVVEFFHPRHCVMTVRSTALVPDAS